MACGNCDRSAWQAPTDDRMSLDQIRHFVEESRQLDWRWWKIALLGGEPTLHPDFLEIVKVLRELKPRWLVVATNGTNPDLIRQAGDVQILSQTDRKEYGAFNHAPRDLGMNYSRMCWIATRCGMGLSRSGYYLCGAAAGIDRVFGFGVGIPRLAEVDGVLGQTSLCSLCGHLHGKKAKDLPGMSKSWAEAYARYRKHRPTLPLYGL